MRKGSGALEAGVKTCTTCKIEKSLSDFTWRVDRDIPRSECRKCAGQRTTRYVRKKKYGLTSEDYNALYDSQNGLCAICGNPEVAVGSSIDKKAASLSVDHDHKTGKVRELLCARCNIGIGHLQENKIILQNAILYLEKHSETS